METKLEALIKTWEGAWELRDGRRVASADSNHPLITGNGTIRETRESWQRHQSFFRLLDEDNKKLHLGLLPEPYAGDLRNAKVVILMKNPSFADHCYWEHEQADYKAAMIRNLRQKFSHEEAPLLYLRPEFCHTGGARYFGRWFRELASALVVEDGAEPVTIQAAVAAIARTVCVVQMMGYASADPPHGCRALPSAEAARAWVREELWPEVKHGTRSLLVMRDYPGWLEGVEDLKALKELPPKKLKELPPEKLKEGKKGATQAQLVERVKLRSGLNLDDYKHLHVELVNPRTPSFDPDSRMGAIVKDRVKDELGRSRAGAR